MIDPWGVEWPCGAARLTPLACSLEPVEFVLPDGQRVSPFHRAAWIGRGDISPPQMRAIRGDWPCLPFGYGFDRQGLVAEWRNLTVQDGEEPVAEYGGQPHGPSANADWRPSAAPAGQRSFMFAYPPDSPIQHVSRHIIPYEAKAALQVEAEIYARRPCRGPFAFHPTFSLPTQPGGLEIQAEGFVFGLTHPSQVEPGVSRLLPNARFDSLDRIPLAGGGALSCRFLPLPFATEEILYLGGLSSLRLIDHTQAVMYKLEWDRALPGCVLWLSNAGRMAAPWSGQNICLGVEPCAAPFDLGTVCALSDNPIARAGFATALHFSPDQPTRLWYRLSAHHRST